MEVVLTFVKNYFVLMLIAACYFSGFADDGGPEGAVAPAAGRGGDHSKSD